MLEDNRRYFLGVDVGTTKVASIIAIEEGDRARILGLGAFPSEGLRKGIVVNREQTIHAIKSSLKEVELSSGIKLKSCVIGIAGSHIYSFNSKGIVGVRKDIIQLYDQNRAIAAAKEVVMPEDREIIHIIPQSYKVDQTDGIRNPIGLAGKRLEANVHIITASCAPVRNLISCIEECDLRVDGITLQPLSSSEAVLTEEEKQTGVALIDIGGGTTDLAIWKEGNVLFSKVFPVGGGHFSQDLSVALKIPYFEAERIKIHHGGIFPNTIAPKKLSLQGLSGTRGREVEQSFVVDVLGARANELLEHINKELVEKNLKEHLVGGIIFTGGGALLKDLVQLGEYVFELPCKLGVPIDFGGNSHLTQNPKYSTVLGLIKMASKNSFDGFDKNNILKKKNIQFRHFKESLRSILREIF